jgi:hypothetical protein
MWSGTPAEFFELYGVAARAIKAHDPTLKVGGPGASGVGTDLVRPFLAYCRDHQVPLDFFSWHRYARDPDALVRGAKRARELLDEFGFRSTESHLNEWHFFDLKWAKMVAENPADYAKVRQNFIHLAGPEAAAFAAASLIRLQDAPVDVCNYYTGDNSRWGMFDQFGVPGKVYYAFLAFNQLMKTPARGACEADSADSTITVAAGSAPDHDSASLLLVNSGPEARQCTVRWRNLPWRGATSAEVLGVDQAHDFTAIANAEIGTESSLEIDLPGSSVRFVRLTPHRSPE